MPARSLVRPAAAALALTLVVMRAWPGAVALPEALAPEPSRGELLYDTHCLQCHTEQIHWREHKLVRDWPSLRAQVDRWQRAARLAWTAEDVGAVAAYLNATVYRFAAPVVSARDVR